jgi:pSer/pThr/pTyr-binding forkhead associated (FHA) protein
MARRRKQPPRVRLQSSSGESYELPEGEHGIGSARSGSVALPDKKIARKHAQLKVEGEACSLIDLKTSEGTTLNGASLGPGATTKLQEGDQIKIGETTLTVFFLEVDASASDAPELAETQRAQIPGLRRRERSGESQSGRRERSTSGSRRSQAASRGRKKGVPTAIERRPYGNDWTAYLLANFFRKRPDLAFDWSLLEKARTHGYYYGDGEATRKITVGFEPCHVQYLLPFFPQLPLGAWPPSDRNGKLNDPGPHPQPEVFEQGFVVDTMFNYPGEYYSFVAWRSDRPYVEGEPVRLPFMPGPG